MKLYRKVQDILTRSLRREIAAVFMTLLLISIGVIGLLSAYLGVKSRIEDISSARYLIAQLTARNIDDDFDVMLENVYQLRDQLEYPGMTLLQAAHTMVDRRVHQPGLYRALYLFSSEGELKIRIDDPVSSLQEIPDYTVLVNREEVYLSDQVRLVYEHALKGDVYQSGIEFHPVEQIPVMYIGFPVLDVRGITRYVAVVALDMRYFWRLVDQIVFGETGVAYLVDRNGIIFAHSDRVKIGQMLPDALHRLLEGYGGITRYVDEASGIEKLAAYYPLALQSGWGLVIEQNLDEVITPIHNLSMLIVLFVLLVVIVFLIVSNLVARFLSSPINQLHTITAEIARGGDLNRRITITRQDEVGQLGRTFNRMLERLQAARQNLEKSEERYRRLFATAPDALLLLNSEGEIVLANQAACELLNRPVEMLVGHDVLEFLPEEVHELVLTMYRQLVYEKIEVEGELTMPQENGTTSRIVWWKGTPLLTSDGEISGLLIYGRDISQRKENEAKLLAYSERLEEMVAERTEALNKAHQQMVRQEKLAVLGRLAGSVGHDLRNPLAVLSNAIYFLRTKHQDPLTLEYLDIMAGEIRRAEAIVADLLNFARTKEPQRERIAIKPFIERVLQRVKRPDNVQVELDIADSIPQMYVDPIQIEQVFVNLIQNAYDAMPDGGVLTIRAYSQDGQVCVEVRDTGTGISDENMEHLFEPLFTTKPKGIGLGLASSKNLVEVNGGTIKVSTAEGEGTNFTVCLPSVQASH